MSLPNPVSPPTPSTAPSSPADWPPTARGVVGCGSGCVALILLQGLAFWLGISAYFNTPSAEGLRITAKPPAGVKAGEKFPLLLRFHNAGSAPVRINSVIARPRGLGGLTVENPQPPPQSKSPVMGSTVWEYSKQLSPGQDWQVSLDARAPRVGQVNAALVVQANWEEHRVRFQVKAR